MYIRKRLSLRFVDLIKKEFLISMDNEQNSKINQLVFQRFDYLNQLTCELVNCAQGAVYSFKGYPVSIDIEIDGYAYFISCSFEYKGITYYSGEILDELGVHDKQGYFEYHDFDSLGKGLMYVSEIVRQIVLSIDNFSIDELNQVFEAIEAKRKQSNKLKLMQDDIKLARKYWTDKKFENCRKLLLKWNDSLPYTEKKRLLYLERQRKD